MSPASRGARLARWASVGFLLGACSRAEEGKHTTAEAAGAQPAPAPANAAVSPAAAASAAAKGPAGKDCCMGLNACKGQGGCAVPESHACAGQNACKGKGGCSMHCPR